MRRRCCVLNCKAHGGHKSKKSFFEVPTKDPVAFKKWEEALRGHIDPSAFATPIKTFVCEQHFKPEQIDRMFVTKLPDGSTWSAPKTKVRLHRGTVPCIFSEEERETIEVKAPKCKETYIFELQTNCDGSESQTGDENEVEQEDDSPQVKQEEESSDSTLVTKLKECHGSTDGKQIEIIFSELHDNSEYDRCSSGNLSDDAAELSLCSSPERSEDPVEPDRMELLDSAPTRVDLREILGAVAKESVINDVDEFSRLCRKYIDSRLARKGRPNFMEKHGLDPGPKSAEKVFMYQTAKLDVETLVSHIDRVMLPTENWFYTIRDGSPSFLCWSDNFTIHKKVIFDMKSLCPTVHLDNDVTYFEEIKKPKSIQEVNNILKLVDSAQKCPRTSPRVCKGYFFPYASKKIAVCYPCSTSTELLPEELVFSLKHIKDSAQEVICDLNNWSVTCLEAAVIFIGWRKGYVPEKLYILNPQLEAQVIIGDETALIEEICSPLSLKQVRFAIKFLDSCVKCLGVNDSHRSDRCRGFVYHKKQQMRVKTCNACGDLKKKLIRAVPGESIVKRTKAKHCLSSGSLKRADRKAFSVADEDNSNDQALEEDEEHILLRNALDDITLPSSLWAHSVVGSTVIFTCWKEDLTLLKKVVVNHDLFVQAFVLDQIIELDVDVVSSVDDVVGILNVVDCLRVCVGFDELNRRHKECTVYIYDTNQSETDSAPYRCPNCTFKKAHRELSQQKTSGMKSQKQVVEQADICSEPPFKKVALEISLSPFSPNSFEDTLHCSTLSQASRTDDER